MKIIVLVKRVPDTETKVKIAPDGKSLDATGVNFTLNPYDEFAVEQGLLLKEKHGGDVIVLSVGSKDCSKEMRAALAMGADSGILLEANTAFCDASSVGDVLAAKIKELAPDLVLLGKQAVDDDNAALGPTLAAKLELACATVVVSMTIEGSKLVVEREIEGGRERMELSMPAIISCQKGLNTPRYASMKGIMMAKKKPITELATTLGAPKTQVISMQLPPARPAGRIVGEGPDAVGALVAALKGEAKVI